jgi:hypothetical protein
MPLHCIGFVALGKKDGITLITAFYRHYFSFYYLVVGIGS